MSACQLFTLVSEFSPSCGSSIPGIFPLAFSDIPRNWIGTASSTLEDIDDAREGRSIGVESPGVGR